MSLKKIHGGNTIPLYSQTSYDWHNAFQQPSYAVDLNAGINEYTFGRTTPNNKFIVSTGLVNDPIGVQMVGGKKNKKITVKENKSIPSKEVKSTVNKKVKSIPSKEVKSTVIKKVKSIPSKEVKSTVSKKVKSIPSKEVKKTITKKVKSIPSKEVKSKVIKKIIK